MSYSDNPVADAARHFDRLHAEQEAQQRAEHSMIEDFMAACQKGDANALATFAPMIPDWDGAARQPRAAGAPMPKRVQTLAEVLNEATDYPSGPSKTELMQVVLNLAFSAECHAVQARCARELLARAANTFAHHNVAVEA